MNWNINSPEGNNPMHFLWIYIAHEERKTKNNKKSLKMIAAAVENTDPKLSLATAIFHHYNS